MLGGPKKVATFLNLSTGAPSRWYAPKDRKGCGGLIPSEHIPNLCQMAKERGLFLEPNMFFIGHMQPQGCVNLSRQKSEATEAR